MKELKKLSRLKLLRIDQTKVGDDGLDELKEMKGLQTVWVNRKTTTHEGRASLKQALPDCHIWLDPPIPESGGE